MSPRPKFGRRGSIFGRAPGLPGLARTARILRTARAVQLPSPAVARPSDAALLARALALEGGLSGEVEARLQAIGGTHGLWHAGSEALGELLDREHVERLEALIELAGRLVSPLELGGRIDDAAAVAAYFRPRLAGAAVESFWMLALDARNRPLAVTCVALGTLTSCLVHPREVYAPAIRARAAAVIVVHNHPSGDPEPSDEDETLTRRLAEAGLVLGIPLLDHVVVARGGYRSLGVAPEPPEAPERRRLARAGPTA